MRRKLVRDIVLYLAATLVLGAAANIVPGRPHLAWWGQGQQPPQAGVDFAFLDAAEADTYRLALPNVVFLDTRPAGGPRVPGALPVAYTDLGGTLGDELMARLAAADAVVIYGASDETDVEQLLAQELRRRGLAPPYVLLGGFPAWEASGLEVEAGDAAAPGGEAGVQHDGAAAPGGGA